MYYFLLKFPYHARAEQREMELVLMQKLAKLKTGSDSLTKNIYRRKKLAPDPRGNNECIADAE